MWQSRRWTPRSRGSELRRTMSSDLVIHGGTVIDPASGMHARRDVAVADGRVTAIEPHIGLGGAGDVMDATGLLVVPGLVDIHVHVYWGGADLSIEPGPHDLQRGVTTMADAGSSGANNFAGFRRFLIEPFEGTIVAFLNIAVMGQADPVLGELHDIRYAIVDRAVEVARANPELIVGLKVRVSEQLAGRNGVEAVARAIEAGTEIGCPVMVHIGGSYAPIEDILSQLRGGDIVTHAFTAWEPGIFDSDMRIIPRRSRQGRGASCSTLGTGPARSRSNAVRLRSPTGSVQTPSARTSIASMSTDLYSTSPPRCPSTFIWVCPLTMSWPWPRSRRPGPSAWQARWEPWPSGLSPILPCWHSRMVASRWSTRSAWPSRAANGWPPSPHSSGADV